MKTPRMRGARANRWCDREAFGVRTEALLTRMDAPLGRTVGNALEVIECSRR
jgi:hypothetical protein